MIEKSPIGQYLHQRFQTERPYYDIRKTPGMVGIITKILVNVLGNLQWIEVKEKDLI